jgi:hypothetical protein
VEGLLKHCQVTAETLDQSLTNRTKGPACAAYKRFSAGPATKHDEHREVLAMRRRDECLPRRRLSEAGSDAL